MRKASPFNDCVRFGCLLVGVLGKLGWLPIRQHKLRFRKKALGAIGAIQRLDGLVLPTDHHWDRRGFSLFGPLDIAAALSKRHCHGNRSLHRRAWSELVRLGTAHSGDKLQSLFRFVCSKCDLPRGPVFKNPSPDLHRQHAANARRHDRVGFADSVRKRSGTRRTVLHHCEQRRKRLAKSTARIQRLRSDFVHVPPQSSKAVSVIIRTVQNADELHAVRRLHHDSWVQEGYREPDSSGIINRSPEFDTDCNTTVFAASENEQIVGTNTLTIDGPLGVPMDHGLKHHVDEIRASCNVMAASWRISTLPGYRGSRNLVIRLIIHTIEAAQEQNVDTCIFLFNKKHERVYKRLIGATTHGDGGAPFADAPRWHSVLMRLDMSQSDYIELLGKLRAMTSKKVAERAECDS